MILEPGTYRVPATNKRIRLISWSSNTPKGEIYSLSGWWKVIDLEDGEEFYASGDHLHRAKITPFKQEGFK